MPSRAFEPAHDVVDFPAADRRDRGAARVEAAALRRARGIGNRAFERDACSRQDRRGDPGSRRAAPPYRGAAARSKIVCVSPASGDLAEIHHDDPVGHVADDREVVGDEEIGEVALLAAGRAGGSGSAPAPRRRARWSARRARSAPDRAPARGRSRCAAAARRRTGADSGRGAAGRGRPARAARPRARSARAPDASR